MGNFKSGDWLAICDVCGWKYHASDLIERWDGLKVCKWDWEPRHVRDFLKIPEEDDALPWTRSEAEDVFISVTYIEELPDVPSGTFNSNNEEI